MYAVTIALIVVAVFAIIYTDATPELLGGALCFAIAATAATSRAARGDSTVGGASDLAAYTSGPFKRIRGAYTTMGESACRAAIYLETGHLLRPATGRSVPWLRYHSVDLELDGLDLNAGMAFEYDGPQHYSYRAWHDMLPRERRNNNESALVLDFYRSRFYDRVKTRLCREHGVRLVRVMAAPIANLRARVRAALAGESPSAHADDAEVIDSLSDVDTRDSTSYQRLTCGDATLVVPSRKWQPHPFHMPDTSLYREAWRRDLARFAAAVHAAGEQKKMTTRARALDADPDQVTSICQALRTP